jgi:hypothetical protein
MWIERSLHPFGKDVGSFIPEGFAAYARVFHPPYRGTPEGKQIPVRWRDIAAANDRTLANEMKLLDSRCYPSDTSASGEELWYHQPQTGNMPREIAARLIPILAAHTLTPESYWFAVWEGYPDVHTRFGEAPSFSVPQRNMFLLKGTAEDALSTLSDVDWIYRSPNLWWPDDRLWCVVTEIDFTWSYVGGSSACVEQILADTELEAVPTNPDEGNFMQTKEWVKEAWARFELGT